MPAACISVIYLTARVSIENRSIECSLSQIACARPFGLGGRAWKCGFNRCAGDAKTALIPADSAPVLD
jgi:hypothetical protein